MEPINKINKVLEILTNNPLKTIRYALFLAGIIVAANNYFDCVMNGDPVYSYILNVGVLTICAISILVIKNDLIICFILAIVGSITLFDVDHNNSLSGGIMFMVGAKRITDNLFFSFFIFILTALAVVANKTFKFGTPADSVNTIIAYYAIFIFDSLIITYILHRNNKRI